MTKKLTCIMPFYYLQIGANGAIYNCCPAWLKTGPIAYLSNKTNILKEWNNENSRALRQSILENNTDLLCKKNYCPYIQSKNIFNLKNFKNNIKDKNLKKIITDIEKNQTIIKNGPSVLNIAISGKCNLRCIMCNSHEGIVEERSDLEKILYEKTIPSLLPTLSEITLTGNGDPFFNKRSREFLINFDSKKYKNIKFNIITNGQLLTEFMWNKIKHNKFNFINVSVDAASKKTYEKIRYGGKWEIIQKNLELISQLRKKGIFGEFILSFVVMKSNYKEMIEFAKMAIKLGCDQVKFQKIFGFKKPNENINLLRDYKTQKEIAKLLKNKIFKDPRIDIAQISDYSKKFKQQKFNLKYHLDPYLGKIIEIMAIIKNYLKFLKKKIT